MVKSPVDLSVGLFFALGLACLAYLTLIVGEVELATEHDAHFTARFTSASGLRIGASVEVGGVRCGSVRTIRLDHDTYEAIVDFALDPDVRLQVDSIASIQTIGIVGEKFIKISPGGDSAIIASGGEILETESSVNFEELIRAC